MVSACSEDKESNKWLVLITMWENILSICIPFSVMAALYQTNISYKIYQDPASEIQCQWGSPF